jgi:archaellum component FlaC
MDENMKDILEAVIFIKDRMTTKDDIAEVRSEVADLRTEVADVRTEVANLRTEFVEFRTETREHFAELRAEIRDIRERLESLEVAARNSAGFAKEIDHVMQRVVEIEKHLGIQHKIAA